MGWRDDARRTIVSEKKELETFPGYWVKVRKYSIQGKDEINAAMAKLQQSIDKKALYSLAKKVGQQQGNKELTEQQVLEMLEPDEIEAFMNGNTAPVADLNKLKIQHGVVAHNFSEMDKDLGTDAPKDIKAFANDILEFAEITAEVLQHIEAFNRPLARGSSRTSEMSPSGSTKDQTSSQETSSQMGETQQS